MAGNTEETGNRVPHSWPISSMCSDPWLTRRSRSQETAVSSRTLPGSIRMSLQLQLRRKNQVNRILRKRLISTRNQLQLLKKTWVDISLPPSSITLRTKRTADLFFLLIPPAEKTQSAEWKGEEDGGRAWWQERDHCPTAQRGIYRGVRVHGAGYARHLGIPPRGIPSRGNWNFVLFFPPTSHRWGVWRKAWRSLQLRKEPFGLRRTRLDH